MTSKLIVAEDGSFINLAHVSRYMIDEEISLTQADTIQETYIVIAIIADEPIPLSEELKTYDDAEQSLNEFIENLVNLSHVEIVN